MAEWLFGCLYLLFLLLCYGDRTVVVMGWMVWDRIPEKKQEARVATEIVVRPYIDWPQLHQAFT